jgi:ATP-binding cassette subfamily F protein 3
MIAVQNLSKQFGTQVIFDNITFNINPRERVGLVGRNGHGKSTLVNILCGRESCDSGAVNVPRDYHMGVLDQHLRLTRPTVLDEACTGLQAHEKDAAWKVKKILHGLGFSDADFGRPPAEFSGGYQVRLTLAKVLASEPNLLLLDEPTNFLDIVSIRWLERFLSAWPGEAMIVSHDRGFMDAVTTHILGIHRCKTRKIEGDTAKYYRSVEAAEEIHEKQRVSQEKKQKQMEQFISRFRAKARQANLVQSRIKALEKMEKRGRLERIQTLGFSFNEAPCEAKVLMEARGLRFSYSGGPPWLIDGFDLAVQNQDRICVVGKNGMGKTTLLKLLAGTFAPLSGEVRTHPQAVMGYFEQGNTARLNDGLTVEEEVLLNVAEKDRKKARDICGAMMFSGDHALKKISVLSGGEKCRVLLGKLLAAPSNLLLLDEPTHHLDMPSCEAMMGAIGGFDGASVVVTHNEHILREVATKLVVFHRNRVSLYLGGYEEFLDRVGWDEDDVPGTRPAKATAGRDVKKGPTKKEIRKARADFFTRRSRALAPFERKIRNLENKIGTLEARHQKDSQALMEASQKPDLEKMTEFSKSIKALENDINHLYDQLDRTTAAYDKEKQAFDAIP